jgi:hypothetical protein
VSEYFYILIFLLLVFYPIAKETKKYFYNDQRSLVSEDENLPFSRYNVQRLDELAVSIDFPHDYSSAQNWSEENRLQPIKNVRFNDNPTWRTYSRDNTEIPNENDFTPIDQYYFHPDENNRSVRYIATPFFWFRPVHNHNYAICIPVSRPSLHAYITSSSTPNPIRL